MYKVHPDGSSTLALTPDDGRCCAPVTDLARSGTGSRRRRVWELGPHAHCPVVGVCLPIAALRRMADKVLGGQVLVGDYELHCGVANDCKQRTRLAEAVQRELDRRFMLVLRRAAVAKTESALGEWWLAQASSKDLPGAMWATLTHPRCTPELELQVLGQVHMLQHQVGMATRAGLERMEALVEDNARLARELALLKRRTAQQVGTQSSRVEALQAEVLRLRGQLLARDSTIGLLRADLQALHEATPSLKGRVELARQVELQGERVGDLQRALQQARAELEQQRAKPAPAPQRTVAAPVLAQTVNDAPVLTNQAVLCVGGRTASVPVYRRLIESCGGRFLHHDGGEEHSAALLESTLAAADLVICQAGCVSHNAYWRVKDHCKRTGKRCVFVETPSASGLQRALASCT